MAKIGIIGGGIAGLGASLALARDGHDVTVLEQDATPLPPTAVEAFERWDRRGAPQVRHSHAFLARLRNLLRERAPDVLDALLRGGAYEIRVTENLPPGIEDRRPRPGDEDLVLLGCRRVTFEWTLRRVVEAEPRVHFVHGARVAGLEAEVVHGATAPRVTGVLVRRGEGPADRLAFDVVLDASGRRSPLPVWLARLGAAPVLDQIEDCGIFYSSRFYQLRDGAVEPPADGPIGADLGYLKFAVFAGDARIFSVTLAAAPDDEVLRRVLRPGPFEAAASAIPSVARWLEPDRSLAITGVHGMAGLRNRRRRLVRDGAPLVLGLHTIGDAAMHSNPLYGRGCALALVHAFGVADVLRAHGDDASAAALALADFTKRELEPWWKAAVAQDREARATASAMRRGGDGTDERDASPSTANDPRAFLRSVLREGLLPALHSDATVLRAFLRNFNLLDAPESLLSNADVIGRVLAVWRARESRPVATPLGPSRDEMLRVVSDAA